MESSLTYASLNDALETFAKIADSRGEPYRAAAYRRAIVAPESVGADLARKIEEYRATRRIRELDELLRQPETRATIEFDRILGFGPTSVRGIVSRGILTRAQLLDAVKHQTLTLTRVQDLGLRHFDDLQRKIPREDVARIAEIIFAEIYRVASDLFESPESARQIRTEIAGSYRRRAPESSDIDILIAGPPPDHQRTRKSGANGDLGRALLHRLHERMVQMRGFIDIITLGKQKYSFLFRHRWVVAIDIIYVPRESFYASLLYFTGSQVFNIWMREQCKKKGYSLNQFGLRAASGHVIILESEEQIFEFLGIPYIAPVSRGSGPFPTIL